MTVSLRARPCRRSAPLAAAASNILLICVFSCQSAAFRTFPDLSAEWERRFQQDDSRDVRTPLFMELASRSGSSMSADVQAAIKFARTLELKGTIGLERLHWPAHVRSTPNALADGLRVSGEARDAIASLDLFLPNASSAYSVKFSGPGSGPDPLAGMHYGRLRALFIGSWADALGDYVAQAGQLLQAQHKRVHAIHEKLQALLARLAVASRKAAAAQKGGAASAAEFGSHAGKAADGGAGGASANAPAGSSNSSAPDDTQGDQRYVLNSLVRPFVAGLATEEAALRRKLNAAQAEEAALDNLLSQLQQEKEIWDNAKRTSAAAADRAEAEAAAAAAARADLERLMAAGQHLGNVFSGRQPLAPAPPPPEVAAAVKAAQDSMGNSTAAALGAMGLKGLSGLKLPAAAFAAKATDLACSLAAAKDCATVESCHAEEIIFASCAALNSGRASAYALAMSAIGKGKYAIAKFLNMPPLFLQLADALKQTILGALIPLYLGGSALHPGGSLPLLCPWIDIRLKEHCADDVIKSLKTAKLTDLNLVVMCLIKAQSMLGPMAVLAPQCLTVFDAFSEPAAKTAEGMTRAMIPAVKDIAVATAELVAAIGDATATMAAAMALYKVSLCPEGFPGSFEEATRRTLQYTYYARRDSALLHGRRLRQRQLHLSNIAASGGISVDDIMSGEAEISAGPLKTAVDAAMLSLGNEAAVEPVARMMRDNAQADWLAATGAIPAASFVEVSAASSAKASSSTVTSASSASSASSSTARRVVRGNRKLAPGAQLTGADAAAAAAAAAASRSIARGDSPLGAALLELQRALDNVAGSAVSSSTLAASAASRGSVGTGAALAAGAASKGSAGSGLRARAVSDADARAEALAEAAIVEAAQAADAADAAARSSSRDAVMAAASELSLFKTCPFGNPYCPAIEFLHPPFWLLFNVLKGGWHPEGTPSTWIGGLPAIPGLDGGGGGGGGGAAGFLEQAAVGSSNLRGVRGSSGSRGSARGFSSARDPIVDEYARSNSALVTGERDSGSNFRGGASSSSSSSSGDITSVYLETDASAIMTRVAEAVARGKSIADAAALAKARGLPPPPLANRTLRTLLPLSPSTMAVVNHPQVLLHKAATQGSPHVLAGRQRVSCGDPTVGSRDLYNICVAAQQVEADVKHRAEQFKAARARLISFSHQTGATPSTAAAADAAGDAGDASDDEGVDGQAGGSSHSTSSGVRSHADLEDAWETWTHLDAGAARTAALQREGTDDSKRSSAATSDAALFAEGTDGLAPLDAVDSPHKAAVVRRQLEAVLDALRPLAALQSVGNAQHFAEPAAVAGIEQANIPSSAKDTGMVDSRSSSGAASGASRRSGAGEASRELETDEDDGEDSGEQANEEAGASDADGIAYAESLFVDKGSPHQLDAAARAHAEVAHAHTAALLEIASGRRSGAAAAAYMHAAAAASGREGSVQRRTETARPTRRRVQAQVRSLKAAGRANRQMMMLEVPDAPLASTPAIAASAASSSQGGTGTAVGGSLRSPATDADLYPNLFFPSAGGQHADRSGTDRSAIDAAIKERDAAAAAAPLQPSGGDGDGDGDDVPIIDRGKDGGADDETLHKRTSLRPGADEMKRKPPPPGSRPVMPPLSFGPPKLPGFPFKVGDQVNVLPPPPIWALLTLLNKGQEPQLAIGYITMLNHVSSLPWSPVLTVEVKLNSGATLSKVPIFMLRHQPKPKPWPPPNPLMAALSAMAGAAGVKVNLNKPEWPTQSGWVDKSYVIPLGAAMIANPAKIIDKTKKVPGVEIVCLPYPCAPVPKPVDPLFTKIDLFPTPMSELGMLAMFLVPGDLYAQAAGYKCDCLCPVPQNGKLTALDCGLLAASQFASDKRRDFTSDASSKKEDANSKFKALAMLAKDFAVQAGMSVAGK